MATKAVLVQLDADRWQRVKAQSTALRISPSLYVDSALAAYMGESPTMPLLPETEQLANVVHTAVVSAVSNYMTTTPSGSSGLFAASDVAALLRSGEGRITPATPQQVRASADRMSGKHRKSLNKLGRK